MASEPRRVFTIGVFQLLIGSALIAALVASYAVLSVETARETRKEGAEAIRASRSALAAAAAGLSGSDPSDLSRRVRALASVWPDPLGVVGPGLATDGTPPPGAETGTLPIRVDRSAERGTIQTADGARIVIEEPIPGAPPGTGLVALVQPGGGPAPAHPGYVLFAVLCLFVPAAFVLAIVRSSARRLSKDLWALERAIGGLAEPESDPAAAAATTGLPATRAPVRIMDADDEMGLVACALDRLRTRLAGELRRHHDAQSSLTLMDRDRLDFLAMMSHELRTPLNTVLGFSEVLLEGLDGALSPGQREDVRIIRASGDHLLGLINDILDLSAIRSGTIDLALEDVDVTALARRVLDEAEGQLRGKRVHLVTEFSDETVRVRADERRLWRILQNLVGNALKFTDEGEVRIGIRVEGAGVEITVRDTGRGIPAEALATIFDEYEQAGDARSRRAGTGLGLAIVKRLVELHGGTVDVESEMGRGSSFRLRLPQGGPSREESDLGGR